MKESYEFPPEEIDNVKIGLLIDILAHDLIILDILRKLDPTITQAELRQVREIRRTEILRELYAQFGKTPNV